MRGREGYIKGKSGKGKRKDLNERGREKWGGGRGEEDEMEE